MLKQHNDIFYNSSAVLEKIDFIKHGFLSRCGGISKSPFSSLNFDTRDGDDCKNISHHKLIIGRLFGFDISRLLLIKQVHGNDVLVIDRRIKDISKLYENSGDIIITNQYNIAIGVLTADCVPIMMVDPVKKVIGIIHAGWRGVVKYVVKNALDAMVNHFGSDSKNILAAIGPSIGQCCYEVADAVAASFAENMEYCNEFMIKKKNKWQIDLKKANFIQMKNAGILEKHISTENICTSCENNMFFSYRADGKITGRQLNFIMLTKD